MNFKSTQTPIFQYPMETAVSVTARAYERVRARFAILGACIPLLRHECKRSSHSQSRFTTSLLR